MQNPVIKLRPISFHWETIDPFIFCVHHHDFYPAGNEEMGPDTTLEGRNIGNDFDPLNRWRMYHGDRVPGFPVHPHRGFETITVVRRGYVDHSDSAGAAGRYGEGDVQWMTAGSGLQHCEMFPLLNREGENRLELFQIWLNLPSYKKFASPHFRMLWSESIPRPLLKDINGKKVSLEIIAGSYGKDEAPPPAPDSWAADPSNEVSIWVIRMEPGAVFNLPPSKNITNRTLYYFSGESIKIGETLVKSDTAADLEWENEALITNGNQESRLLFLQGRAVGEPVEQYGPFVMNTRQEITEAINDYRRTSFGGWPWPRHDNVHAPEKGRFALYPGGREETPG